MFCLMVASHWSARLETWLGRKRETSRTLMYTNTHVGKSQQAALGARSPPVHTDRAGSGPAKQKYRETLVHPRTSLHCVTHR